MSTRSNIGIINKDGTVEMIYCHSDGYPSHNGRIVLENYSDEEKLKQLLSLGAISILGPAIGEKHDFDDHHLDYNGWCLAYHRDRGDKLYYTKFASKEEALNDMEEYLYLWDTTKKTKNKWIYSDHGEPFKTLTKKIITND